MPPSRRSDPPRNPAAVAPTLDAHYGGGVPTPVERRAGESSDSLASRGGHCPVELVRGSGPEMTQETQCLLRRRLRLAAVLLAVGFAAFWFKAFFTDQLATEAGRLVFGLHSLTLLAIAAVAIATSSRARISLAGLRGLELLTFGFPVVFFLVTQYLVVQQCCERGFFDFPIAPWLLMIYTYALFIPNTLRRASVVIGSMAALPIVALMVQLVLQPMVAERAGVDTVVSLLLAVVLAAVSAVFGVDTIGSLRRQAFAARQLGHYRLKQSIGVGGMGEVYLAEHGLLKRPCVIKLIRPERAGDPRALARFQREVRATAKLTHWNTIEIFDYGNTDDGTFYYVMEYLPGMSLGEIVERFGPLPAERVVHLLLQACDGLREAHAMGLIHRDLKPGNIFAAQRGGVYDVAKVLDFGLVKPIVGTEDDDHDSLQLTTEGSITGSPLFMSPEQAVGDTTPDRRSDIYSLGAVAYYLLCGRPPFEGKKPLKVLFAHAHEEVVPPSQSRADVPADLEHVVLRCLAKKPADRYQTVSELAAALEACESAGRWNQADAARWWQHSANLGEHVPV